LICIETTCYPPAADAEKLKELLMRQSAGESFQMNS